MKIERIKCDRCDAINDDEKVTFYHDSMEDKDYCPECLCVIINTQKIILNIDHDFISHIKSAAELAANSEVSDVNEDEEYEEKQTF